MMLFLDSQDHGKRPLLLVLLATACLASVSRDRRWSRRIHASFEPPDVFGGSALPRRFGTLPGLPPPPLPPPPPPSSLPTRSKPAADLSGNARSLCSTFPGLSREQRELCHRHPDLVEAAQEGIRLAAHECQLQFQKNRWNCSSLEPENRSIHSSAILRKGYKESAFASAITAAGVQYGVAKACTLSKARNCGCHERSGAGGLGASEAWHWDGCYDYIRFSAKFAKSFLDSLENGNDFYSVSKLHNNKAGRLAVIKTSSVRCKCHGMSGSCEMKTCWKSVPAFHKIGNYLKKKYYWAKMIDPINNSREQHFLSRRGASGHSSGHRSGRPKDKELVYYEKSPNYCDPNPLINSPGTTGRVCNRTGHDSDSCSSMCCGRGYSVTRQMRHERCGCRFHWCCQVVCDTCLTEEWITVCK